MAQESAKVMFEIYREAGQAGRYRAVYFTELDEHNKDTEISRAMEGEHLFDGFLAEHRIEEGKRTVDEIISRLNKGERVGPDAITEQLEPYGA